MSTRRRAVRAAAWVITGILVVAWWIWLAPPSVGGSATPVVVRGSSMEPTYHHGDLVLVRESERYRSGQIIAYRAEGTTVIHRIQSVEPAAGGSARYRTSGDNLGITDPWVPDHDHVLGAAIAHVPAVGRWTTRLDDPLPVAVVAGLLAGVVAHAVPERMLDGLPGSEDRPVRPEPPPHGASVGRDVVVVLGGIQMVLLVATLSVALAALLQVTPDQLFLDIVPESETTTYVI